MLINEINKQNIDSDLCHIYDYTFMLKKRKVLITLTTNNLAIFKLVYGF